MHVYHFAMYYAYILRLRDKTYYHGYSSNLIKRVRDHAAGEVSQTRNLRPVTLVFYAAFLNKKKALDFEAYLKTYSGFAFRNKRLT